MPTTDERHGPMKEFRSAVLCVGLVGVLCGPMLVSPAEAGQPATPGPTSTGELVFPTVPELGTAQEINGLDSRQIQARIDALGPDAQKRLDAAIAQRAHEVESALWPAK